MMISALLFAGQGAQTPGMGRELAAASPAARHVFEWANAILGFDLATLCFEGPEAELTRTENAQPALYVAAFAALAALRERVPSLSFGAAAGLSLGEFTALAAAGALEFEEGLRLVRARGQFMQAACEAESGAMAAVIGLEEAPLRTVCEDTGVAIANLNCPGQIVLSGAAAKMPAALEAARARGARKALPLAVAGAYHSPLMAPARARLADALASVRFRTPVAPVLSNVTGRPHESPDALAELLAAQVTSPVRWEDSMRWLLGRGFGRFIEFGPGGVLTGFMKRIDKSAVGLCVEDAASLENVAKALLA